MMKLVNPLLFKFLCLSLLITFFSSNTFSQINSDKTQVAHHLDSIKQSQKTNPIITVKFKNGKSPKRKLKCRMRSLGGTQKTKKVTLNEDGSFTIELDNNIPYQELFFSLEKRTVIILMVNDDLEINVDASKLKEYDGISFINEAVEFLGIDSELQRYYNNYFNCQDFGLFSFHSWPKKRSHSDVQIEHEQMLSFFEEYNRSNPSDYSWIIENEILTYYYRSLCNLESDEILDDSIWDEVFSFIPQTYSQNTGNFYYSLFGHLINLPLANNTFDWEVLKINDKGETILEYLTSFNLNFDFPTRLFIASMIERVLFIQERLSPPLTDFILLQVSVRNDEAKYVIWKLILEKLKNENCIDYQKQRINSIKLK